MGTVLGPCKKCGRLMMRPHQTGICKECRQKTTHISPNSDPDLPDPLKYE
ncbi:MAG: hypothetical protein ACXACP_08305 [Candidatus Hodarchaeales archaeon]|jgi:uncharacterized OB-fold protein